MSSMEVTITFIAAFSIFLYPFHVIIRIESLVRQIQIYPVSPPSLTLRWCLLAMVLYYDAFLLLCVGFVFGNRLQIYLS